MLLCSCGEYDGDGWSFWIPKDFSTLETKRRRRCKSCNEFIDRGAICLKFERFQYPQNEVQCAIYGDWDVEIDLAPYYFCEHCGEIYLNLEDAGFCLWITDDMRECLKEYHELTGFEPNN